MGKPGNGLSQHHPISAHVWRSHLEKIVEIPSNQMGLFYFRRCQHGLVKGRKSGLTRVAQLDFDKGDMIDPTPNRIQNGAVPADHAQRLQPPQARLGRGLAQTYGLCQRGDADPPIGGEMGQNRPVVAVQL